MLDSNIQERIQLIMPQIVAAMVNHVERDRVGCHLYFVMAKTRQELITNEPLVYQLFLAPEREADPNKARAWEVNSKEKPLRTAGVEGCLSSFAAGRNPDESKYGGGIAFLYNDVWYAGGGSGFTELGDDAALILLCVLLDILQTHTVMEMVKLSGSTDKLVMLMTASGFQSQELCVLKHSLSSE